MRFSHSVSLLALCCAAPLLAQEEAAEPDTTSEAPAIAEDGTIIVRATRLRGQLDVDQPPVLELDADEIAAYGAGSITDLLQQLAPATSSSRGRGGGRPVFLINGVRVGSFREFRSYPPEAIAKVEVFAEEVAQRFGFSPDQRVVNIVLKDDYSSREVEVEYEQPDRGGYRRTEQELNFLTIDDGARINAEIEASQRTILTESERDLELVAGSLPDVAGDPDPRDFRSLVGRSESYQAEVSYAKAFIESGSSISGSVTASREDTLSLSGLDTVTLIGPAGTAVRTFNADDPLTRDRRSTSIAASGSYNRPIGTFQLTATADAGWNDARTLTARRVNTLALEEAARTGALGLADPIPPQSDAGTDRADSTLWNASSLLTLRGQPILLPAGEVSTTFDLGYDWDRIESRDSRAALATQLTRGDLSGGVGVNVPIASRRDEVWDALGSISLNAQAGFNRLSDFGTLYDWTLGVNWEPFDGFSLSASRIWREVAPGLAALGNPTVTEFNTPVFDYASGQSVLADVVTGGNPALRAETQADWKFSANWNLPFWERGRLQVDYAVNRSDDVTLESPAFTSAFEAAFPARVTRDAANRLLAVDRRPVTLFETRSKTLTFGLNGGGTIGKAPPESSGGRRGPRDRGGEGGPPPSGGAVQVDAGRFAEMRQKFCATPEGETPDLSGLPEQMLERLRGPDGTIPPERIAQLRERFCSGNATERDSRLEPLRAAVCADPPDLDALPAMVRDQLKGEDGEIDPAKLARLKERLCSGDAAGAGEGGSSGGSSGGSRRGGMRGMFGGNPNDTRPRYFISLNHTIALENEVLLAPGGPIFDQLDGFTIAGGALPRQSARLEGGLFFQGYGLRLSGQYVGEAVVRGSGLPGSSDLFYGDLATFDLRLFVNLGEVLDEEEGWLKNLRVSLRADNVFDARRRVVDENGDVPLAFQPFRIDPTGRYIGIDIRKLF